MFKDCPKYQTCKFGSFVSCACLGDVEDPFSWEDPLKEIDEDIPEDDFEVDASLITDD